MTENNHEPKSHLLSAAQEAKAAGRGRIILLFILISIAAGVWLGSVAVNDANQKKEALQSRWAKTRIVSTGAEAFKAKHGIYPSRFDAEFLNTINESNPYKDTPFAALAPANSSEWVEIQRVKSVGEVEPRVRNCAPGHVVYCFIVHNGVVDNYFVVGKDTRGRVGTLDEFRTLVDDVRKNSKARTATSP
jgi:hypothetical protein